MSQRITDKDLGALDSLEALFDEHGVHMPGASAMLPRLIAEVRALREENDVLRSISPQPSPRDEEGNWQ